jgi:hypothetical protein
MFQKVNNKTVLTGGSYDLGRNLVALYIPATSSLYFGLGAIWDLPYVQQICGTLALLATFFGVVLHVSSNKYDASGAAYDGNAVVTKSDEGLSYSLELDGDPADLANKNKVTFKVVNSPTVDH